MAEVLNTSDWQTPLPLSTVSRSDGRWRSDHGFRGGAWPAINYSIASGLAAYGHRDLAADITDKMVAHVIRQGISEYYDSISGKPLGVRNNGMVCVILTMMLDGLCRKHSLEVRKT
ncbi:MAG: hypothetical protein NTV46_03995 [Verrucomicrobia bacterium]|nr:hypothetical protein [Verrucomicrobiota bacterium]